MRLSLRSGLAALVLAGFTAPTQAQQQPKAPARPQGPSPAVLAKLSEAVATVNGEKITRGELIEVLNQVVGSVSITPGTEETYYKQAIDYLANTKLLNQFLKANGAKVDAKDIDGEVDVQRKMAADNNTSLEAALAESGMTYDQMRDKIRERLLWRKYITNTATDSVLQRFMKDNLDVFNRAQVKASHIQLNLDPKASPADKAKAREKLSQIKKDVEAGKITFADAANKYSEDPSNVEQPSGGDLRYFPRKKFVEPFDSTAFSLKPMQISEPIETEYGMHIIQATDRKPGIEVEFARIKEQVFAQFALEEQERIVADMRKKADIKVQPMPADLFPKNPAAAPATAEPAKPKG